MRIALTSTYSVLFVFGARGTHAVHTRFITNENLIGLVNGSGVSIHHLGNRAWICPVAFIFGECAGRMVNRSLARP